MYESNRAEALRKIGELIKGIHVTMLVTRSGDGTLHARPMATQAVQEADFDGTLWFFTAYYSNKVTELSQSPEVVLAYADPGENRYVSLSGRATLVRDLEKARELWSPLYREWFPKGADDPELALLRVDVERAEYWDAPGMFGMVGKTLAGLSARPPAAAKSDGREDGGLEGTHGTVRL